MCQVLTVAVNSGLVTYPKGYKKVWTGEGVSAWAPQPPEDYVALGHVAASGQQPPSLMQVKKPDTFCSRPKCVLIPARI